MWAIATVVVVMGLSSVLGNIWKPNKNRNMIWNAVYVTGDVQITSTLPSIEWGLVMIEIASCDSISNDLSFHSPLKVFQANGQPESFLTRALNPPYTFNSSILFLA